MVRLCNTLSGKSGRPVSTMRQKIIGKFLNRNLRGPKFSLRLFCSDFEQRLSDINMERQIHKMNFFFWRMVTGTSKQVLTL